MLWPPPVHSVGYRLFRISVDMHLKCNNMLCSLMVVVMFGDIVHISLLGLSEVCDSLLSLVLYVTVILHIFYVLVY